MITNLIKYKAIIEETIANKERSAHGRNISSRINGDFSSLMRKENVSFINVALGASTKKKIESPLKSGYSPDEKKKRNTTSIRNLPMESFENSTVINRKLIDSFEDNNNKISKEQQQIIDACLNGQNVFLTGGAGTGKSTTLKIIIQSLIKKYGDANIYVTATTGLAAFAIGGCTVHHFAGIGGAGEDNVDTIVNKVTVY